MEVPIEECSSAHVYKASSVKKWLIYAIIAALYAVSVPFCYKTAGDARAAAIIQAQRLADERWEAEVALETAVSDDTADPIQRSGKYVPITEDTEFVEGTSKKLFPNQSPQTGGDPGWLMSWVTPSKEQRRAEAELKKIEKEFKEKNTELPSLPPTYLPSAWAVLSFLATITIHALFFLLCRWLPQFKAFALFEQASAVVDGCFVLVVPPVNRGKTEIVKTTKSPSSGSIELEFQRQKYFYLPVEQLAATDQQQFPNGALTLSSCPVDLPISNYLSATGLRSEIEVQVATERYGKNHLSVHIPSFLELLKNQLLSPLSIFQVFCALLWLLDEYWTYTMWTLVMVVVFEASTVFQRTRTQKMLGGTG